MGFVRLTVRIASILDHANAEEIGFVIDPSRGQLAPIQFRLGRLSAGRAAAAR